jgi:flagellar motor switch protein FliN/FliY
MSEDADTAEPSDSVAPGSVQDPEAARTAAQSERKLAAVPASSNMSLIMDIPVTVTFELGRTQMSVKELVDLNPGTVIELHRLATEPLEILVNGTLVAYGEAVRVGERYGVRLTELVNTGD